MANKAQKPLDQLTNTRGNRRGGQLTVLSSRRNVPPPTCPRDMLLSTQTRWEQVWNSRLATRWDEESDLPQIDHLFWSIDERDRDRRAFRRKRIVQGSGGQAVMNPLSLCGGRGETNRVVAGLSPRLGPARARKM